MPGTESFATPNSGFRCDAIVLAGGESRRMGADKAQVRIGEHTMTDLCLAELRTQPTVGRVVVVTPKDLSVPPSVRVTCENPPFGGPVAGIEAGLASLRAAGAGTASAECDFVFVTAVDAPFTSRLLEVLWHNWQQVDLEAETTSQSTGVVVVDGEPLCALWRKSALRRALRLLSSTRDVSVRRLIRGASAKYIQLTSAEQHWCAQDYDTPADVAQLRARLLGAGSADQ
ncbi:MAG: molybdenum cofactor guanylyltransferase [Corynebacterium sp.]|uniref:molybdenum cofactor guanylyltransferase n=1 Tax=Corynebacterium sp. TaxID=1720 RepID=UPI0026DD0E27|nr:molybdenum cofactor guanylyltransferase [Corynebacterium sp.]MDO5029612.1 molybdenum cofactor guanylyltransferase [Corynebacterium sp.]